MFLQAFGAAGRILSRRIFSQARRQCHSGGRPEQGCFSYTRGGILGMQLTLLAGSFLRRGHKSPAMVIAVWSTAGIGLWYMNKIAPPSKVD